MTDTADFVQRATIEHAPIRVQFVRLTQTLADCWGLRDYPNPVRHLLAEMMAATALLADDIKFDGTVALQARGAGTLSLALAECAGQSRLRAIARQRSRAKPPAEDADLSALLGAEAAMALSLIGVEGQLSQAVVSTDGQSISDCIEHYFAQSVQVPTHLKFVTSERAVTGLCIQRLPDPEGVTAVQKDSFETAWRRVLIDFERADTSRWPADGVQDLLKRCFSRHWIRVHSPRPLEFSCSCTAERSARALEAMTLEEALTVIDEDGEVVVTCEFCGRDYTYDEFDVRALHSPGAGSVH